MGNETDLESEKAPAVDNANETPKRDDAQGAMSHQKAAELRRRRMAATATKYNEEHPELVAEFNQLTKNACAGTQGGVSYLKVRDWQREHGSTVDGKVGPDTVAKAKAADPKVAAKQPAPKPPVEEHLDDPHAHDKDHDAKVEPKVADKKPEKEQHLEVKPVESKVEPKVEPKVEAPKPVEPVKAEPPKGDGQLAQKVPTGPDQPKIVGNFNRYYPAGKVGPFEVIVVLPPHLDPKNPVDVFLFFHGVDGDYTSHKVGAKKGGHYDDNALIGSDISGTIASAGRNLIGIFPWTHQALNSGWSHKAGSYGQTVKAVLKALNEELGLPTDAKSQAPHFNLGNVSLAGHSAGGSALGDAAKELGDSVTDMTWQDAGYAWGESIQGTLDWLLSGKEGKILRIISQQKSHGKGTRAAESGFSVDGLKEHLREHPKAMKKGLKITPHTLGKEPDSLQPGQLFAESKVDITEADGKEQATINVFRMGGHHFDIRDDTMSEAIKAGPGHVGFEKEQLPHAQRPAVEPVATAQSPLKAAPVAKDQGADLDKQILDEVKLLSKQIADGTLTGEKAVALLRAKLPNAPKEKLDHATATLIKLDKVHQDQKKQQEESKAPVADKAVETPSPPKAKVEDAPAQAQPQAAHGRHHVAEGQKITDELIEKTYKGSGVLSQDKLTLTANDRKDDKYFAFKQKVYLLMVEDAKKAKGEYFPGVPPGELLEFGEGADFKLRTEVVDSAKSMIRAARTALKADQAAGDAHAKKVQEIGVASAYRDTHTELTIWNNLFSKYFHQAFVSGWDAGKTHHDAAALHDYSDADARVLANLFHGKKAAPGLSNHTAGRALDMSTNESGHTLGPSFGDWSKWEKSWLRHWLEKNAATYQFQPLTSEMWHWDFFG